MSSCSGSIHEPASGDIQRASQRWPEVNAGTLRQGRQLYIAKCSGCHSVKAPSRYSEAEWDSVMTPMGKKAKLGNEEYEKILHYVLTMSKK